VLEDAGQTAAQRMARMLSVAERMLSRSKTVTATVNGVSARVRVFGCVCVPVCLCACVYVCMYVCKCLCVWRWRGLTRARAGKEEAPRIRIGLAGGTSYSSLVGLKLPNYSYFGPAVREAVQVHPSSVSLSLPPSLTSFQRGSL